ncbi:MAG: Flagellar biosynthesis protein FlhF [Pelotomaculum sp. PtaB.Bin013]|nr:MAG: Flagellar biosynthesis protein FlhF [Pelotomaculum sp. PtaB.Bin013]
MKIKRYVVREMQEAIRLIKQDLGPDAVIVSSYKVPAKGIAGFFMPRLLEVTAALDEPHEINLRLKRVPAQLAMTAGNAAHRHIGSSAPLSLKQHGHGERTLCLAGGGHSAKQQEEPAKRLIAGGTDAGGWDGRQGVERRSLFEMIVNKEIEGGQEKDLPDRWRKALLNMDLQADIVESLLTNISDKLYQPGDKSESVFLNIRKQIVHLLEPAYKPVEKARVLTFVGPTGVGKTTTLAKLATRFSLNDRKKIALVAVHTYRLGDVEQLQAYGNFLNTPVQIVMTPAELGKVVENNADKDYIFIDTAGRSARNTGQVLELKSFLDAVQEPQDVFLVLSSTTKNRDLNKIANEFLRIKFSKLIFTKLDETETLGSILNLVCTLGMPVAYLADGQGIPDSICEAKPNNIAELLFRGVDPDEIIAT